METNQFCSDDILFEIFTFLPAKSLMRLKCISKACNTLIRHPNFARSHYARSQCRPSSARLLFELKAYPKDCCRSYYNPEASNSKVFPLELNCFCYPVDQMSIYSNNCNGLVCWYSYKHAQVYLYNVTTKEIKPFPALVNLEIITSKQYGSDPKLFLGFDGNYYKMPHVFDGRGGGKEGKILTLGVTNSSWRKINVINKSNDSNKSCKLYTGCIFLNGVVYWYSSSESHVVYFNFRDEKFGYILPPNPIESYSFGGPSSIRTALWRRLVIKGPSLLSVYDDVNEVFTEVYESGGPYIAVAARLNGAEMINDSKMKEAYVLATASVMCAPASLLSSSKPCYLRFVSHCAEHNDNKSPRIMFKYVSSFVENIIPLTSLLV